MERTVFYGELQRGDRFKYKGGEYIKAELDVPVNLSDGSTVPIANFDVVIPIRGGSE